MGACVHPILFQIACAITAFMFIYIYIYIYIYDAEIMKYIEKSCETACVLL